MPCLWDPASNTPISDYQHDLELKVKVVPDAHPITAGVEDFTIHDEGYSYLSVLDGINPLLTTDHPFSGYIKLSTLF